MKDDKISYFISQNQLIHINLSWLFRFLFRKQFKFVLIHDFFVNTFHLLYLFAFEKQYRVHLVYILNRFKHFAS